MGMPVWNRGCRVVEPASLLSQRLNSRAWVSPAREQYPQTYYFSDTPISPPEFHSGLKCCYPNPGFTKVTYPTAPALQMVCLGFACDKLDGQSGFGTTLKVPPRVFHQGANRHVPAGKHRRYPPFYDLSTEGSRPIYYRCVFASQP